MNRCFGWGSLVLAGVLLAVASGTQHQTVADSNAAAASAEGAAADNGDTLAQLKEIRKQLKEINDHLHSGVTKVMIPMNPNKRD